jgi:16S rRNA (adenine1518-N6/adenine1519-N6)-dimethyltransferase
MINFRPKKSLGQHFLINESVAECILSAARLNQKDVVVEVGSGRGILTKKLAERIAKVIAVELDTRLVSMLNKKLGAFPNVTIVHADILKITPERLLKENVNSLVPAKQVYKVVANLPYYIASPILWHFLRAESKPSLMVIMVQKEVGEAIAAAPGKMTQLSIGVQFYSKPAIITYVPAKDFRPMPKVDSVVLRLDVYSKPPVKVTNEAGFLDIIHCGFNSPRKQLRNSLAHALAISPNKVCQLLEEIGIDATRRAETLTLEEWQKVWKAFTPFRTQSLC